MPLHYSWQGKDLLLRCHLQPNASSDEIVGIYGDRLKLRLVVPPIDGNANEYLIRWLATVFSVPKNHIAILQGERSKQKNVRIRTPKTLPEAAKITF